MLYFTGLQVVPQTFSFFEEANVCHVCHECQRQPFSFEWIEFGRFGKNLVDTRTIPPKTREIPSFPFQILSGSLLLGQKKMIGSRIILNFHNFGGGYIEIVTLCHCEIVL